MPSGVAKFPAAIPTWPVYIRYAPALSLAPTVVSLSPNTGSYTGGTSTTITGTNFVNGATVTIGGVAATGVTWVNSTTITCTTPAGAIGAATVVVTNPDTQTGTLVGGFTFIVTFTPASLNLNLWVRANYAGSPWTGTASAGTSSTHSPSEGTNPATVGTAVAGFNSASFNGTSKFLADAANMSTIVGASAGTFWALVMVTASTAGTSAPYDNPAVIADVGGNVGLHIGGASNDKFVAYFFDGIGKKIELTIPVGTGTWVLMQMRWNGTILEARVNGGTWTSVACGTNAGLGSSIRIGRNWSAGTAYLNADVLEVGAQPIAESDANLNNVRAYLNFRYGAGGVSV